MDLLAPRVAPGIGIAMARVASRFYFFSMLLAASTIYLPHKGASNPFGLISLAVMTVGMMTFLAFFPWDRHGPRVFTLTYILSSCSLLSLLVLFTGGLQSSYHLLFFLVIFFSFYYNKPELFTITTIVSGFYLLPYLYDKPDPHQFASSAVTIFVFYLGTYLLANIMESVLKRNKTLEGLNNDLLNLYSMSDNLIKDLEQGTLPNSLLEKLKDHIPATYCLILLLDEHKNLITRAASPIRSLTWLPHIGSVYAPDRMLSGRMVLETRQPRIYRIGDDEIDEDLRVLLTRKTSTVLVVPIRSSDDHMGIMIFGEERQWNRSPFSNERIQLAVAMSRQIANTLSLWWCYERLVEARHHIEESHQRMIKAERLASLGEITSIVEHEINNPLSVIVNWSEIYREDATIDPVTRQKFQVIYDMAMRISSVMRKLPALQEGKTAGAVGGRV